tara:strand:+ start:570 stop:941 length:372 start_codon:yes stop_codon:yes gene_type:complete
MDFFKFFIFGIAGVSLIFWVAVIALWHTYMFPRIFKQDSGSLSNLGNNDLNEFDSKPILGDLINNNDSLPDRRKYSMKSLVVADFNNLNNLKLDNLYTAVTLGVAFASFTIITYGLHSGFPTI